jgi:DNA-binding response OmpR family regulator
MARILVVEDDIDIAALVAHKLRSAGHDVAQVEDGDAALAAIREQRPDLVVLDWMIPGPDGIAVCETVRADPELAATRILMLTAKAQESDFERAFRSGADEYMQKPFSTRELVVRAESILARG